MKQRLYFALFFCLSSVFLAAQPTIDGDLSDAAYTTVGTFTSGRNSYGDENDIGAIRFYTDNTTLYIGITGELNSNNSIVLFLNFSGYGGRGVGTLNPTNAGAAGCFNGSGLDGVTLDMDADFAIAFNEGNSSNNFYADGIRYGGVGVLSSAAIGNTANQTGTPASFDAAPAFGGTGNMNFAYNNGFSPGNPNLGVEFSIPIAAFDGVTNAQTVQFFALITNANGDPSNETIPGDTGSDLNPPANFNFSSVGSQDFFTSSAMLPVELSRFEVEVKGQSAKLFWRTENELNNHYFEIQRSEDARNWSALGRMEGNGTTFAPQEYIFMDDAPRAGVNYYRLRQVDYDGAFEFSTIEQANFGPATTDFECYPNPAKSALTVQWQPESGRDLIAELFDATGKVVYQKQLSMDAGRLEIDLQLFAAGVYALRLSDGDTGLMIKQLKVVH